MVTDTDPPTALLVSGPVTGGMRTHLRLLGRWLPAHGYRVRWATPTPIEADPPLHAWLCLPLTDRATSALRPGVLGRLALATRCDSTAVIHAHGYKAGLVAALASLTGGSLPRVVTFHNMWPATAGGADRAALRLIARRAALVAVSGAVAASLRTVLETAAVTVIGNGIDLDRFRPTDPTAARAALGLAPRSSVVGFFGRLTREKGADLALAAVRRLRTHLPEVRLLVVGEGPERRALEAEAGPEVCFLGQREDVPELLAACDVVVIPSRSEGQSVIALEAMAAARPVVAAAVGGLAETVAESGGRLVEPDDPGALAVAVQELLADPVLRENLGARGREWVSRNASAEQMSAAVAALYDRLSAEVRS